MTSLERALAGILESIEDARSKRDALALTVLLQRKNAICAALTAPEHHWQEQRRRGRESDLVEVAGMPLVA